jgi:hypothetical protein
MRSHEIRPCESLIDNTDENHNDCSHPDSKLSSRAASFHFGMHERCNRNYDKWNDIKATDQEIVVASAEQMRRECGKFIEWPIPHCRNHDDYPWENEAQEHIGRDLSFATHGCNAHASMWALRLIRCGSDTLHKRRTSSNCVFKTRAITV